MSRALLTIAAALMVSAAPPLASANDEETAAGAVTGAVAGAAIGGPIGAVIGAVVGGVPVGAATAPDSDAAAEPVQALAGQRSVGGASPPLILEPETTGTVVETRTCVRDAQGVARCRRDPAR